jgi:hypothetical protein
VTNCLVPGIVGVYADSVGRFAKGQYAVRNSHSSYLVGGLQCFGTFVISGTEEFSVVVAGFYCPLRCNGRM